MLAWIVQALAEQLWHTPAGHHPDDINDLREHDPHYGMHPALYALVFGIVSGTSLPLGSWLGIQFSPVSDTTCALMMAFGAGALLFAVTVELYGHALREVAKGNIGLLEMFTTIFGALCGAAFYLSINQWLEEYLMHDHHHECKDKSLQNSMDNDEEKSTGRSREETDSLMAALHKQKEAADAAAAIKKAAAAAKSANDAEKGASSTDIEESTTASKPKSRAKELWGKARRAKSYIRTMSLMAKDDLSKVRGREKALRALHDPAEIQKAKSVAFALFLGLLVDGVPEGILMGFLSAEGHLTPVLIISLFVANFPEAFSSASLLIQAKMPVWRIILMWTGLCLLVGSLAGSSCYLLLLAFPDFGKAGLHSTVLPTYVLLGIALVEGITGGAMIACISSVMLPEAFQRADKTGPFWSQSGFLCTAGFLLSVSLKAVFG